MHTCVPMAFRSTENRELFQVAPLTDPFSRKSSFTEDRALPLSLSVFGALGAWEGWLVSHGGSTWPARSLPSQSTAIPQKQLPATRWQQPSLTLLFHTCPNSGADLQANKHIPRLGTGAPLLFQRLTEGGRGSDLCHPSQPPPHAHKTRHTVFLYIQEET